MGKRKPYVVGDKSGHRTILKISGDPKNHRLLLQCDCGSAPHLAWMSSFLSAPRCLACGAKTANRREDGREVKNNSLYRIWAGMKTRCNPLSNGRDAKRYAHKGIRVCYSWRRDFGSFETWALANGYKKGLSLDRIDSEGDYEPRNCEWVSISENSKRGRANYVLVKKSLLIPTDEFHAGVIEHGIWQS